MNLKSDFGCVGKRLSVGINFLRRSIPHKRERKRFRVLLDTSGVSVSRAWQEVTLFRVGKRYTSCRILGKHKSFGKFRITFCIWRRQRCFFSPIQFSLPKRWLRPNAQKPNQMLLAFGLWSLGRRPFSRRPIQVFIFCLSGVGKWRKAGRKTHLLSFRFLTAKNQPFESCWGQFHKAIPNYFVGSKNVQF